MVYNYYEGHSRHRRKVLLRVIIKTLFWILKSMIHPIYFWYL